jgi:hypothetical protein
MIFSSARHTVFESNTVVGGEAGMIYYFGGASTSIFSDNEITEYCSPAIWCASSITIKNSSFRSGDPRPGEAVIHCESCSPTIEGNLIASNYCETGIRCESSSPNIVSNTIVGNRIGNYLGGGISVDATSSPIISRNIIMGNRAREPWYACGGIYSENPALSISCNNVFDNDGGNYVGIPDQTGINGNISIDPIFCNPEGGVYTLHVESPCMPGRHPDGWDCGLIGAFGSGCEFIASLLQSYRCSHDRGAVRVEWSIIEPRPAASFSVLRKDADDPAFHEIDGARVEGGGTSFAIHDQGVEPERTYVYRVACADEAGWKILFETDPVAVPALPATLYQNYPNPFNPSTSIEFYVPRESRVAVDIYDVSGRRVANLADAVMEKGLRRVVWNGVDEAGSRATSGMYFYTVKIGKESLTRKMVLMR